MHRLIGHRLLAVLRRRKHPRGKLQRSDDKRCDGSSDGCTPQWQICGTRGHLGQHALWHVTANEARRPSKWTIGSSSAGTPRPTCSRMTTADGRSPGLRVNTCRRLPESKLSVDFLTEDSPLTVAGAAADLGDASPSPRSLLIPNGEPSILSMREFRHSSMLRSRSLK